MDRLYIAVRADLAPGLQAAQAVHASFLAYNTFPELVEKWLKDSNYLVIVAVPSEDDLIQLYTEARLGREVRAVLVREPDLGDEATAVAFEPGDEARRLCANFPLALRWVVPV